MKENYLFSKKDIVALILPLIVEQLLATVVGMADSMMIASVGEAAVSGVSLVDSVMILLFNVFSALATGGAVVAGQYLGQKREKYAKEASAQLMYFTFFFSLLIMALCFIFKPFILNTVFGHIDGVVKNHANIYLIIVLCSVPFMGLYCAGAAIFRAMGNSKVSMQVSLLMNIMNVVGNAVLIFGFHCGTEGVAIPTLISRVVGSLMIVRLLMNPSLTLALPKTLNFKIDFKLIKKILYIGIPNGLENSMFQLGKIIVLSLVSTFGTSAIAANAVAGSLATFQVLPGLAISLAVTTVVARCIGANDISQAKYYTKLLMKITYAAQFVTCLVIFLGLPYLLNLYQLSKETYEAAYNILLLHGFFGIVIWPIAFTLPSVFRASGDVSYCMTVSIISMWVCRILFSYVIAKYLGFGVFGVWIAMIIDWFARAIFFMIRYKSDRWTTKIVV